MSKVRSVRRLQIGEKIVDSTGGASPAFSVLWQELSGNSKTLDASKQDSDADLNAIAKIDGTGIAVRSDTNTWALRSLAAPAAGFSITNPAGIAGNPTFALSNDLAAVEGLSGTGFAVRTATDTWANRTLQAGTGISITNPAGIAGNPTFVLANDLAALEALSGTNTIYYRSATDTWTAVTIGTGLDFTAGTLSCTVSGGGGGSGTVTTTGSPASGNLAKFSGSTSVTSGDLSGDVTTSGTLATTLATSGVTAATYGDSTHVAQITVDAKGRITSAANVAVSGGGPGAMTLIATSTPSGTNTVAFTSIPGTYTHLQLRISGRTTGAVTNTDAKVQFNSDTGSNYDIVVCNAAASVVSNITAMGIAYFHGALITGASGTAGYAGHGILDIFNYADTNLNKSLQLLASFQSTTASSGITTWNAAGGWRNSAAITRIDVTLASGNFTAGSVVSLYGIS